MIPGIPVIRKCGKCSKLIRQHTLLSGNTFGARFYSDMKSEAPMLPSFPLFSKCPNCGEMFWIEKLEIVKMKGDRDPYDDSVPSFTFLNIQDSFEFLLKGLTEDQKDEYIVRLKIMQLYNDRIRHEFSVRSDKSVLQEEQKFLFKKLWLDEKDAENWRANLNRLYELSVKCYPDNTLFLAEIKRELGEFKEAAQLVEKVDDSKQKNITDKMKQRIEYLDSLVFTF